MENEFKVGDLVTLKCFRREKVIISSKDKDTNGKYYYGVNENGMSYMNYYYGESFEKINSEGSNHPLTKIFV